MAGAGAGREHAVIGPPPRLPDPHFVPPPGTRSTRARTPIISNFPFKIQNFHSKTKSPPPPPPPRAGAEFDLIERLHASGSLCALVDVILWECHQGRGDCVAANERLASCPNLKVLVEGPGGDYIDAPLPGRNKRSHIYMG